MPTRRTTAAVLLLAWAGAGCETDRRTPPIVDLGGGVLSETPELRFEVSVIAQADDVRAVDVFVLASVADWWTRLPSELDEELCRRLVVVRPLDGESPPIAPAGTLTDESSIDSAAASGGGLAGKCEIEGDRLRFRPSAPLQEGVLYRIEFHPSAIPGYDLPGSPPSIPIPTWHLVPK